jgi:hypothetical protein
MVRCSFYLSKSDNQCSNEASYVFKDQGIFLCGSHLKQYNTRPDRINFGKPVDYNLKRAVVGGYEVLSLEDEPKSKPRRAEGKAEASRVEGKAEASRAEEFISPESKKGESSEFTTVEEYIKYFNELNANISYNPNSDVLDKENITFEEEQRREKIREEIRAVQLLRRQREIEGREPPREKAKLEIPQFEIPAIDLKEASQTFEQDKAFISKLSTLSEAQQQLYKYTLSELNSYISNQIFLRNFIDSNYIFKQIQNTLGFLFGDYFIKLYVVPVFEKIQTYNTSGYGMADFLTNSIQFKIFEPEKKVPIFTPQNDKTLTGTKNIVFLNKPDKSIYSEYVGQYKNTNFPQIPYVELKFNKNSLSNKFICIQRDLNNKNIMKKEFKDVNQARGFCLRGGFYADTVDKNSPSVIDERNERRLKVVPIILR